MEDIVGVWRMFRDPLTGFWCDNLYFADSPEDPPTNPCGPEVNVYSSAGTGMGLISEAILMHAVSVWRKQSLQLRAGGISSRELKI